MHRVACVLGCAQALFWATPVSGRELCDPAGWNLVKRHFTGSQLCRSIVWSRLRCWRLCSSVNLLAGYLIMQCRYKTKRNWTLWGRQWESPLFSCHGRLSVYNCVNATLASQNLYLLYNNRTLRLLSRAQFESIDKRLRSRTASVPLTALWMLVLPPDWTAKILSHFESHRRFHRSSYSD